MAARNLEQVKMLQSAEDLTRVEAGLRFLKLLAPRQKIVEITTVAEV